MCIKITEITDTEIRVNDKTILKDMDGTWRVFDDELTVAEAKAFSKHLEAINRCTHPPSAQSIKVTEARCTCETTVTVCKTCGRILSKPKTDC